MKKLIALLLLLCTFTLVLSSCGEKKIEKPEDTNLEYWLLESADMHGCTKIQSKHPCTESFLSKSYEAILDEDGNWIAPDKAVVYNVENYPYKDLEIGTKKISCIKITDPNVYVWGLTINSSREEIVEILDKLGYKIYAERPDISISFRLDSDDDWHIFIKYGEFIEILCDFMFFYQL